MYNRFIVIGLGGGWLLPRLLAFILSFWMRQSKLILVDGGVYKLGHKDHEMFPELGNKARVTAEHLRRDYPTLDVRVVKKYVGTTDSDHVIATKNLIQEEDVVFVAVDNLKTRNVIDAHAQSLNNVTVIYSGVDDDRLQTQIYIRRDGRDITPPVSAYCNDIKNPDDESPADRVDSGLNCPNPFEPVVEEHRERIYPFCMMTSSMMMANAFYSVWRLEQENRLEEFPYKQLFYDIRNAKGRTDLK